MPDEHDDRYVGDLEAHCQGTADSDRYVTALNVASAKAKRRFVHAGSDLLDRINAFDLAESGRMNMGQINLIEVSSFCGPLGLLWGRDIAAHPGLRGSLREALTQWDGARVPVYDGEPLIDASKELFGTIAQPVFPLAPGTHCPTASKSVTHVGQGTIYAACAFGVRAEGAASASIIMEDVGLVRPDAARDMASVEAAVKHAAAESVLAVAANQRTVCSEIFVSFVSESVAEDEVGCCVTLVPYFRLARRAAPDGIGRLRSVPLPEWKRRSR